MRMRLFFDSKHCKREDLKGRWLQFALIGVGERIQSRWGLKLGRSGSSGPTTDWVASYIDLSLSGNRVSTGLDNGDATALR